MRLLLQRLSRANRLRNASQRRRVVGLFAALRLSVSWFETYQYLEVAARGGLSWKRPRFLLCVLAFVCFLSLACLLAPHHNFAYSRLCARSPLSVVWCLCVFPSLPFFSSSSVVARSLGQCDVTRGHVCGFVRGWHDLEIRHDLEIFYELS